MDKKIDFSKLSDTQKENVLYAVERFLNRKNEIIAVQTELSELISKLCMKNEENTVYSLNELNIMLQSIGWAITHDEE